MLHEDSYKEALAVLDQVGLTGTVVFHEASVPNFEGFCGVYAVHAPGSPHLLGVIHTSLSFKLLPKLVYLDGNTLFCDEDRVWQILGAMGDPTIDEMGRTHYGELLTRYSCTRGLVTVIDRHGEQTGPRYVPVSSGGSR